jgi:hypothetical protein
MNAQTKAVVIAAAAGLAIGLLSVVPSAISEGITPLDTFNIFNAGVIGHWVGRLGIIPWIFIIIAAAMTAGQAGLLSSIAKSLGAIVGVSLVIAVSIIAVAASQRKEFPLSRAGSDRTEFVTHLVSTCVKGQQKQNENIPAAIITEFCTCVGNSLADVTTRVEAEYLVNNKMPSPSMKMRASYQKCSQTVRNNHP